MDGAAPSPIPRPGCRSKAAAAPATRSARPCCVPPWQLFLEQGYHRATLNEVAERLNITKPALYNYFRGKDEILFECWAIGAGTRRRAASPKSTPPAAPGSPSCAS